MDSSLRRCSSTRSRAGLLVARPRSTLAERAVAGSGRGLPRSSGERRPSCSILLDDAALQVLEYADGTAILVQLAPDLEHQLIGLRSALRIYLCLGLADLGVGSSTLRRVGARLVDRRLGSSSAGRASRVAERCAGWPAREPNYRPGERGPL